MSLCRDRQIRGYWVFLTAFSALLLAAGLGLWSLQGRAARTLYLEQSGAVASALLELGLSPADAAAVLRSGTVTPEGAALLEILGIGPQTPAALFPALAEGQRTALLLTLALCGGLILLLAAGTLVFLRRRGRLYRQAEEAVRRCMEGDFSAPLPGNREGDLFQLFHAVEELAARLRSRGEAEHLAREFLKRTISDISHQLKTPLAAMMMYQEIVAEEPENAAAVAEFSGKMGDALLRMEQLIQAMLKIARLDAGNIVFERREIPLPRLMDRALRDLRTRAEREGKELRTEGDPGLSLTCDPAWTAEAVGNLVKNALDHTAPGGHVLVAWDRTPAMLRIRVEDDGGGIDPGDLYHIFKRFYRSRRSLDTPGVGLGLPLVKSIAEGQGGAVSVQSEPGRGTAFFLDFPLSEL